MEMPFHNFIGRYCALAACCLLIACNVNYDRQYFLAKPEQIAVVLQRCELGESSGAGCLVAKQVETELLQLSLALRSDPQAFGKKILDLQVELGQARANYQTLQQQFSSELQTQLFAAREQVRVLSATNQSLLTVIRLTESVE